MSSFSSFFQTFVNVLKVSKRLRARYHPTNVDFPQAHIVPSNPLLYTFVHITHHTEAAGSGTSVV